MVSAVGFRCFRFRAVFIYYFCWGSRALSEVMGIELYVCFLTVEV